MRIQNDTIKRGGLIGRGAFGFVYEAVCRPRGQAGPRNVALKMLQPINPGLNADEGNKIRNLIDLLIMNDKKSEYIYVTRNDLCASISSLQTFIILYIDLTP